MNINIIFFLLGYFGIFLLGVETAYFIERRRTARNINLRLFLLMIISGIALVIISAIAMNVLDRLLISAIIISLIILLGAAVSWFIKFSKKKKIKEYWEDFVYN